MTGRFLTAPSPKSEADPDTGPLRAIWWRITAVLVVALAFVVRIVPLLRGGGLGANVGYDASVYYAASDGLVHGRLPYRDFVLLHPPGMMLVLTPFAEFGRLTSDHAGFILAGLAFSALGAFNAGLLMAVARRLGLSLGPALAGGLFAALWIGSIQAEYLARLEPLGNFFVLVALYAFSRARLEPVARWFVAMGLASGAAVCVKIWYVVPMLVLVGWVVLYTRNRTRLAQTLAGAGAVMVAVNGVFFVLAPSQMWHMIITSQLGRARIASSLSFRLIVADDLRAWHQTIPVLPTTFFLALALIVFVALLFPAWTQPGGRVLVVLVVVQSLVLAAAPSWFSFYSDYLTPAAALVVATGIAGLGSAPWLSGLRGRRPRLVSRTAVALGALAVLAAAVPLARERVGDAFPGARLSAAVRDTRCVVSDSPMALIELDALSRSFAPGCHNWVDVTGRTYGVDKGPAPRSRNRLWQKDLTRYLVTGDAFITIRASTGYSAATRAYLKSRPVLARAGSYTVYRGTSPSP